MPAPLSQATCDRVRNLLKVHTRKDVAAIVGIAVSSVHEIQRRRFRAAPTTRPFRARPSDFAIQSNHLNHAELCAHYRASSKTVTRWRRELGQ